jgi:hypothetical protein
MCLCFSNPKMMIEKVTLPRPVSPSLLILGAISIHLLVTVGIYAAGRLAIFQLFDENGFSRTIILDHADYLPEVQALAEILTERGVSSWFFAPLHHHLKPYSLGFAALQPWLGATILSAEPVNLLCYVAVLCLTFALGKEVFSRSVGIAAAGAVALWPSFLLHTTQLLKDPLFISALLLLLLVMVRWLTRALSLPAGLTTGFAGGVAICIITFTKDALWSPIIFAITAIGVGLLLARHLREKRFLTGNVVSALLVLSAMGAVLVSTKGTFQASPRLQDTVQRDDSAYALLKQRADSAAVRISHLRHEFVRLHKDVSAAKDAGSNIDAAVEFANAVDVLRYLPRALMIGFLAPFPDQWFVEGTKVGLVGRLASGLEMSVMYLVEILVLVELWRSRSRLSVWLLFCVAAVGVTSLALAVINVGALYRMRYAFFIVLLVVGTNRLMQILFSGNRERGSPAAAGELVR